MAGAGFRGLTLAAAVALAPAAGADDHIAVDSAIVLAVDVSGSMDAEELAIQRAGYLAALRHPDLIRIIAAGSRGQVALSHFEWAGQVRRESTIPWRLIDGPEAIAAFADEIEALPLRTNFGTSIALALDYGVELLETSGFAADAWVIDVSGDGPNNMGPPVTASRDRAVARGVTINGLPIIRRPSRGAPDLVAYFEACVVGGLGGFVQPAHEMDEIAPAIRRKLFRELIGGPVERLDLAADSEPVDCMIGERLRRERGAY